MIADKEVTDRGELNFTGGADVTPIVDVLYGSLYQFAVALTRSESDAADLVQQTFLSLIQRLHQIRDFSKIKCWLFTTLRRNFLIEVRRRRKCSEVEFRPVSTICGPGIRRRGDPWMRKRFERRFCKSTKGTG